MDAVTIPDPGNLLGNRSFLVDPDLRGIGSSLQVVDVVTTPFGSSPFPRKSQVSSSCIQGIASGTLLGTMSPTSTKVAHHMEGTTSLHSRVDEFIHSSLMSGDSHDLAVCSHSGDIISKAGSSFNHPTGVANVDTQTSHIDRALRMNTGLLVESKGLGIRHGCATAVLNTVGVNDLSEGLHRKSSRRG